MQRECADAHERHRVDAELQQPLERLAGRLAERAEPVAVGGGRVDAVAVAPQRAQRQGERWIVELRSARGSLRDLTENIGRLRAQLRELEIAAETQMQSRFTPQPEANGEKFDPLEFDRFTRLQELTRLMAESVNVWSLLLKAYVMPRPNKAVT